MGTFGVKRASDEPFYPSIILYFTRLSHRLPKNKFQDVYSTSTEVYSRIQQRNKIAQEWDKS